MERTIAIDSGKYLTKAAMRRADGSNSLLAFRTKVDESNMDGSRILNPRETHLVKLGGVYYVVGEGTRRSDVKEITKASAIGRGHSAGCALRERAWFPHGDRGRGMTIDPDYGIIN